jgi:hypothetical protein
VYELEKYQLLGDLNAPFELTRKHHRAQETSERIKEYAGHVVAKSPPLSDEQIETIAGLLSGPPSPKSQMLWRLRLYCGLVIERTAHASHTDVQRAFSGSISCTECRLDPSTIVDAKPVGIR